MKPSSRGDEIAVYQDRTVAVNERAIKDIERIKELKRIKEEKAQ